MYHPSPHEARNRNDKNSPLSSWSDVSGLLRTFGGTYYCLRKALHLCKGCSNSFDSKAHAYWCLGGCAEEERLSYRHPSTYDGNDDFTDSQLALLGCEDSGEGEVIVKSTKVKIVKQPASASNKTLTIRQVMEREELFSRRHDKTARYRANKREIRDSLKLLKPSYNS
jgi:hypothetical protein